MKKIAVDPIAPLDPYVPKALVDHLIGHFDVQYLIKSHEGMTPEERVGWQRGIQEVIDYLKILNNEEELENVLI